MYSREILNTYIRERLEQMGSNPAALARELGITQSNLTRALNSEKHHLTLSQFSELARVLQLTPEQLAHIVLGDQAPADTAETAQAQLTLSYAQKIFGSFRTENNCRND